jgi:hypothetical protein
LFVTLLMSKRRDKNRFASREDSSFQRKQNSREERKVQEERPKILFSFKDFDSNQGQTFSDWEKEGLLSVMLEKLKNLSELNMLEAVHQRMIKIYEEFPVVTDFTHPKHIADDVSWAVITSLGGQKGRIAGHVIDNVFYIVFLDKEHRFWVTKKKGT